MALTPRSFRHDVFVGNKRLKCGPGSKPCGNTCIPKDHTCRASWNKPVAVGAGTAAVLGAGLVGTALFHPRERMRNAARGMVDPVAQAGFGLGNIATGNFAGAARNAANIGVGARNFGTNARTVAEGYGTDIGNAFNRAKTAVFKWRHHRPAGRKDSAPPGLTPLSIRTDAQARRCGKGYVAAGKKCHKGGAFPTRKAIAIGLGAAGLAAGALSLRRHRGRITPVSIREVPNAARRSFPALPPGPTSPTPRVLPGDRTTRRLTGSTPKGLLPPRPPKSKTQRLRENTQAAVRGAERAIGRAAQAEITRLGAVGNAMASAGEASGMATKTTLRELRLRAEAMRRRYEPGYRRPDQPPSRPQSRLPEGGSNVRFPFTPPTSRAPSTENVSIDPRTGQPRRRRPRGFG